MKHKQRCLPHCLVACRLLRCGCSEGRPGDMTLRICHRLSCQRAPKFVSSSFAWQFCIETLAELCETTTKISMTKFVAGLRMALTRSHSPVKSFGAGENFLMSFVDRDCNCSLSQVCFDLPLPLPYRKKIRKFSSI